MSSQDTKIIYAYRCKICQWSKTHSDVYLDLHRQVLEAGLSMTRAMNYINARIENERIDIAKLNNQNMSTHFNTHVSIPDRVNQELAKASDTTANNNFSIAPPPLSIVNPTVGHEVEDMIRRKVGNDVNDYLNLDSLRAQMMEKLEFLDDVVTKEVDGKKLVDLEAMAQYTTMIKEIRNCIIDLNKIRQSKQMVNMVIKSLIEKQTFQVVRGLSKEYDQIKQDLLDAGVDDTIVRKTDQQMRVSLAQIVAATARAALEDVIRTYKLM